MGDSEKIVVRVPKDSSELAVAFRLRYEMYLEKGYIPESPSRTKSDNWDLLPGTRQFIALENAKVIGSVRFVPDSPEGLPMEQVFPGAIRRLKKGGKKIAEASALVVPGETDRSQKGVCLKLCRAVWQESEQNGVVYLCIAVTQNHLKFYEKLSFRHLGQRRRYKALNGVFAYPLGLHIGDQLSRIDPMAMCKEKSLRRFFLGASERK